MGVVRGEGQIGSSSSLPGPRWHLGPACDSGHHPGAPPQPSTPTREFPRALPVSSGMMPEEEDSTGPEHLSSPWERSLSPSPTVSSYLLGLPLGWSLC